MRFGRCGLGAADESVFLGAQDGASVAPGQGFPSPHPLLRHRGSAFGALKAAARGPQANSPW